MIRVVIADDHPLVRSGIRSELARHPDEFNVVGEAVNGDETLELVQEIQPDILLLDIQMPGRAAIEVLREVKGKDSICRVIILTAYGDTATILGMVRAGADGYLLKDDDPMVLAEAIRAVAGGRVWLSSAVSEKIASLIAGKPKPALGEKLTKRELDVLYLLAEGSTNKEIAAALHTSERTIEFHVSNILGKLGVKGRWEAVNLARERGLL